MYLHSTWKILWHHKWREAAGMLDMFRRKLWKAVKEALLLWRYIAASTAPWHELQGTFHFDLTSDTETFRPIKPMFDVKHCRASSNSAMRRVNMGYTKPSQAFASILSCHRNNGGNVNQIGLPEDPRRNYHRQTSSCFPAMAQQHDSYWSSLGRPALCYSWRPRRVYIFRRQFRCGPERITSSCYCHLPLHHW